MGVPLGKIASSGAKSVGKYYKGVGKSIKANPSSHLEVATWTVGGGAGYEKHKLSRQSTHQGITAKARTRSSSNE